jgi:ABC-type uncharacterized transport system permease subunit
MRLELRRRPQASRLMALLSPLLAIALTLATGALLFALLGKDPLRALHAYFVEPLSTGYSLQELGVKATPLVLIGIGLTVCFLCNAWNIGAEGQLTAGAIAGGWLALTLQSWESPLVLPLMLLLGAAGGLLYGLIPAVLKARFNANEILTSLMLVYVAQLALDYLVRGPWRDPKGFNFPQTQLFSPSATLPLLAPDGRLHIGLIFALLAVVGAAVLLGRTVKGFEIRVAGEAPKAAAFAGFSRTRLLLFAFAVSGALAGLAGIMEAAGPIGQLLPTISPGYGFAAIIVAFLARLNPVGVLFAGLLLALSYIGGENAQISIGVSSSVTRVFQGILLFYVLACDTLILYRLRIVPRPAAVPVEAHGRA